MISEYLDCCRYKVETSQCQFKKIMKSALILFEKFLVKHKFIYVQHLLYLPYSTPCIINPVSRSCRINWLHLCREVRSHPYNECPGYDIKQSDDEAPVILELWGMWTTPHIAIVPRSTLARVVAPDRVLSKGQIELFDI